MKLKTLKQKMNAALGLMKYGTSDKKVKVDACTDGWVAICIYFYTNGTMTGSKIFAMPPFATPADNEEEYNKALKILTNE